MALNLKTLGTRALTALVFVVVLLACVSWNYYLFAGFFFVVSMLGLYEFYKLTEKLEAKPFKFIGFSFGIIIYFRFLALNELNGINADYIIRIVNALLITGPFCVFTWALFSKEPHSIKNAMFTIGGVLYTVLPFALLNQLVFFNDKETAVFYTPGLVLGIIFLIWSNDTFAYLGGSLFGKNKMIERVSPGKTWEGTVIGILITFGLSFLFNNLFCLGDFWWPVLGICVPILATIGDLVESKLKREAEIKDSGNIMPGHGGILDRFDSLIFVSPFIFALFKL